MIRFSRIPALVSKSTKEAGRFTILGWGGFENNDGSPITPPGTAGWWPRVMAAYNADLSYVAAVPWSAWSAYSDVQCGRVYSSRMALLSHLWNGRPSRTNGASEVIDYDVKFNIQWPEIPAGAQDVSYIVQEWATVGGQYSYHIGSPSDPSAVYIPTPSVGNGELGLPVSPVIDPWGETNAVTSTSNYTTLCCTAWIEYLDYDGTDCDEIGVTNDDTLTDSGAVLHSPIDDMPWVWGEEGEDGNASEDGILTGLAADTWYWFTQPAVCPKTFWFKTKKKDDDTTWTAAIITLPATEVWATGATMHGLFHYKGNSKFYVALGFEYGSGTLTGNTIRWLYTLGQPAHDWGTRGFMMPIQMTIAGLLPDTTYNYRACLHVHNSNGTGTPMNTNNYFGATLSFGGPVSMFGFGREYVTAKKAEDDVSRMAAGRYYMDKEGVFQYESYQRRKT